MEAFEKIQLSFKCPKALDELQPCESNWYCDGCRKMVYDFRGMEEEQILDAFAQSGQKLCGIYDANRIKVLPQQPRWYRWAQAAVMALGMMIMNSCGFGEKSKTITTVGVLLPPPPVEKTVMGVPPPSLKIDTLASQPKVKKLKVKFPPPVVMGDVDIPDSAKEVYVGFAAIEIQPSFPGGEAAWTKFIMDNIKYNGEYRGKVYVQFLVEKDGSLTDFKIVKGGEERLNEQIISAIKKSPKWRPGLEKGVPTNTQFIVPLNFTVEE